MDADYGDEIEKLVINVTETIEENRENIIIKTVAPYLERVTEQKISKAELRQMVRAWASWKSFRNGDLLYCPCCGTDMRGEANDLQTK